LKLIYHLFFYTYASSLCSKNKRSSLARSEVIWGSGDIGSLIFLTLALDEGEWLYSRTLRSDPGERNPMSYEYEPAWAPELYKEGEVYFSLSTI
jgi:hypothetical protein